MLDHQRLDVYRLARQFNRQVEEWARAWPKGRSDLVDQLRRSSSSCMLNIAEGSGEFAPKEKVRFYRMARRSANEASATMDALADARIATDEHNNQAQPTLTRIVAMLVSLIRSVENDRTHHQRE
jgi:four helix bundle protein